MDREKYETDLKEIKGIMLRSTRFISLSGLSGVSTGLIAMAGLYLAYHFVFKHENLMVYHAALLSDTQIKILLLISVATLLLSIVSAFYFTVKKTKKQIESVSSQQTRELLFNLSIPLITGGLLCLMLLQKGFTGMLPSLTLIFYGLALLNGSKYSLPELKQLSLIQIVLGLSAFLFIKYGLIFWALGFGVFQILYGIIVQIKYKL